MKTDERDMHRENVTYYPFANEAELELAKFLVRHFNRSQINQFLRLKWVSIGYEIKESTHGR